MTDIFISYAKEDREVAKRLAAELHDDGWQVFWDRRIDGPNGKTKSNEHCTTPGV